MKTPNIDLYKYNKFGVEFYGYHNIYDDSLLYDSTQDKYYYLDGNNNRVYVDGHYFYYSDTTGEKIYTDEEYEYHFFLDKTDVHYIDDIYEYLSTHGTFTIPFNVTFVCDTNPSGNTYDLDWGEYDYNPNEWYETEEHKYEATFTINADVKNNVNHSWTFNYPKDWKIKYLYEFHKEGSSGGSGSGSSDVPNVYLITIDFRQSDDLSAVVTADYMFSGCGKLTSVNFANSTLANLESADYMFSGCVLLGENSIVLNNNITFANLESAYNMFDSDSGVCGNTMSEKILNLIDNGTFNTYIGDVYLRFVTNQVTYLVASDSELYIVQNENNTVTGNITIPSNITKSNITFDITEIDLYAFKDQVGITGVTILADVTSIWSYAFIGCSNITSVTLPSTVERIDNGAFKNCTSLTTINLPEGLLRINEDAFWACALTSVTIPSTLTTLGYTAFGDCNNISSVTILTNNISANTWRLAYLKFNTNDYKLSVTDKDKVSIVDVFNKTSLTSVTIPSTVTSGGTFTVTGIGNFGGCVNMRTIVIPNTVTSIGEGAFTNCGSLVSMTLPDAGYESQGYFKAFGMIFGTDSYTNGVAAHQHQTETGEPWDITYYVPKYLQTVVVTNHIAKRAFEDNWNSPTAFENLQYITIPSTQTSIAAYTFYNCVGLKSITIPSSVTSIGASAFYNCVSLEDVLNFENTGVTSIGDSAFGNCTSLESISFPNTLTTIDREAFYNSGLKTLVIPDSVTTINSYRTFGWCANLTSITVGKAIETIALNSGFLKPFENSININSVTVTNTATSLVDYAFSGLPITTFTIPSTVTTIGASAFSSCNKLKSPTVPSTVTSIGASAFSGVTHIYYNGSATWTTGDDNWGALYLNGYADGDFLYADSTKTNLWAYMGNGTSVTIPSTVTSIGGSAFKNHTSITTVTIPSSVTSIGASAFSGCTSLTTVTGFGNTSITALPDYIFDDCYRMTSITIPSTVTSIGVHAFYNCYGLTSLTIPTGVTSIGNGAFAFCNQLTSITNLENTGITQISNDMFAYCYGLSVINVPSTVTSIGTYAFRNCSASITYPPTMTEIEEYAFAESGVNISFTGSSVTTIKTNAFYNASISSITIPSTVTTIEAAAFSNCTNLKTIIIPSSVTTIGVNAFTTTTLDSATINCSITSSAGLAIYHNGVDYLITSANTVEVKRGNTTYSYVNITVEDFTAGNSFVVTRCNLTSVTTLETLTFGTLTGMTHISVYGCTSLQRVVIPNTVTALYSNNFVACDSLVYVYIPSSVASVESSSFGKTYQNPTLTIDCQVSSKPSSWASDWILGAFAEEVIVNWNVQTPNI